MRVENRVLSESLQELPEEAVSPADMPPSSWSWGWGEASVVAALLALGLIVVPWINEMSIPAALQWLNPFGVSGRTNVIFNISYFFANGGTSMLADYAAVVGKFLLALLLGGGVVLLGRRLRLGQVRLLSMLVMLSLPGFALEHRHSDFVTVAANETVDDTLLATGNIVRMDGVINGDLLAFGSSVEVRGTVKGDLVCFAKRTIVSGTVEGNIYDFSNSLDLDGQLGHSMYGLMQSLRLNSRGRVGQGMVVAAGDVSLEGEVRRSVNTYVGNADVSGTIGRELSMTGDNLTLASTARVGGNLSVSVRQLNNVHIADGATIGGTRDIHMRAKESRFARPRFYFYQAVWLAAAMLLGWLGLLLFPGFCQGSTQAVGSGWRSLGLGVALLAGVPVVIILTAITLVGLPASFMMLALYLAAIYLAKIWVGAFLGRILLQSSGANKSNWLLGLLVGLLIITMIRFVPYLGGLVHFVVICVGLGGFAWQLYWVSRPIMPTREGTC
jgi:hypothetical protein